MEHLSMNADTITAIATPEGHGGIGIVRVSGSKTAEIAQALLGTVPKVRTAHFAKFLNASGETLDHGLALFFKAPHSFTGEDVLELQGHGGPIILDRIIKAVLAAGARLAEPGEFSKRAFLNDKIDLAQAEAIADLIASQSEEAAQAAMRSLEGEFSKEVNQLVQALTELRMYIEAAIDFPEEEIDFLGDGKILYQLTTLIKQIESLQKKAQQGSVLREGINVVITGLPNAGKSSLLNALAGQETAIVTEIAGTTRDILKEKILIDGIPIHILDTAGLRDSADRIEQEGVRRAKLAIQKAQAVLLLIDISQTSASLIKKQHQELQDLVGEKTPIILVLNKTDLIKNQDDLTELLTQIKNDVLPISAQTHQGLDKLKQTLKSLAGVTQSLEGTFLARRRHLEAIQSAYTHMEEAQHQLVKFKAGELLAEELRQAQIALSDITGKFTADDLLGKIFSSFCIGK